MRQSLSPSWVRLWADWQLHQRIRRNHRWRLRLYRTLAARFRAQRSFMQTIGRLAARSAARRPGRPLTGLLSQWSRRMEQDGDLLHDILLGWVPPEEYLILAATPTDGGLDRAAWLIEKRIAMSGSGRQALLYPLMLLAGFCLMLAVIGQRVLPTLIAIQSAAGRSDAVWLKMLADWAWAVPLPLLAAGLMLRLSLPRWIGPKRLWLDLNLWPWTHYRKSQGVSFLLAYSAMWGGGMSDLPALQAIASTASPWLKQRVEGIAYWLGEGRGLGEAMDMAGFGFPDPELIEDIADHDTDPGEMASHLVRIAEDGINLLEQEVRLSVMILGIGIMAMTVAAVLSLALYLMNAFDPGLSGAPLPH